MGLILKQKITGPAAWTGQGLAGDTSWIHVLTADAVASIDAALAAVKGKGLKFPHFGKADFPLDAQALKLPQHANELENGRGFMLMRGLPVERYSEDDIRIIYYGIGLHLGEPVHQNPKGELLGSVMTVGDVSQKTTRVYETNLYLPYHSDPSDVVGLLCLRRAHQGGVSSLVSVAAVYNRILRDHPEYLALYYRPWYFAHLFASPAQPVTDLQPPPGQAQLPVPATVHRAWATRSATSLCRWWSSRRSTCSIQHDPPSQHLRLDMMLEPGDLQFANNYAVLHSRNAEFDDHDNPALHRKLRLWLKMPNARTLAPEFPGRNGFPG